MDDAGFSSSTLADGSDSVLCMAAFLVCDGVVQGRDKEKRRDGWDSVLLLFMVQKVTRMGREERKEKSSRSVCRGKKQEKGNWDKNCLALVLVVTSRARFFLTGGGPRFER